MASLFNSVLAAITGGSQGTPLLPSTQQDALAIEKVRLERQQKRNGKMVGGLLVSDMLNGSYITDDPDVEYVDAFYDENGELVELVDMQEMSNEQVVVDNEMDLVAVAYGSASNKTFRENRAVYRSDFYKDLNPRIPHNGISEDIVWRIDVDHPVVVLLMTKIMAEPVHIIRDQFGDQLVYHDCDVRSAVDELIDMCNRNNFPVLPDPVTEEEEEEETQEEEEDEKGDRVSEHVSTYVTMTTTTSTTNASSSPSSNGSLLPLEDTNSKKNE